MNPLQSSRIMKDITGNTNQLQSRISTDESKLRSKSLCNTKKTIDYIDNSKSKLNKYNQRYQNFQISTKQQQKHRVSVEQLAQNKFNKRPSLSSYTQKNQKSSNINSNSCSIKQSYSLWTVPTNQSKQLVVPSQICSQISCLKENQNLYFILLANNTLKVINKNSLTENFPLTNLLNDFITSESVILEQIFVTPYATFLIDANGKLYAMGLNDRGQLGIKSQKIIQYPTLVSLPFNPHRKITSTKNKILTNQKILKIQGGPFHTVILTATNKIYYSGLLYEESQLQNDQYLEEFREISINNETNIREIKCGLTSVVFLTESNKIYLMGIFGEVIFSNPTLLQFEFRSKIRDFAIIDDTIYILTGNNQIFKADLSKKMPIITEVNLNQMNINPLQKSSMSRKMQIQGFYTSQNQIIIVTKQFSQQSSYFYSYFILRNGPSDEKKLNQNLIQQIDIPSLKLISPQKIFITQNSFNILVNSKQTQLIKAHMKSEQQKILINKNQINNYLLKIKLLQEENYRLKKQNNLFNKQKKQKQKTPKKQDKLTLSNINYNFQKQVIPRTFTNDLEIQFPEIKLNKKIAQGGYGIIYKGEWKKTEVAVKIFKIDQNNTNSVKQFISECRAMQALRHPNIVMFLGACMKKPNFAIVLQYCQGGTLWSLLQNHKIELPWKERVRLAIQTAKAMNYLHDRKNPIVHRDLKSLNVLLDANRRVKLADFGWTKSLQNYMTSKIGTYQWMAPEVLTGQKYSQKADVFSFSIILWEIASRQPPYRNINGIQVAYDVANKQYRPSIPGGTPVFFEDLITRCWEKQPVKRPSFREIIQVLEKEYNNLS